MLGNWVKKDDDRLGYGVITVQVESCWMKSPVDSLMNMHGISNQFPGFR